MRSLITATVLAVTAGAGVAHAQEEISLGWYEDNWEATTFPTDDGWGCTVDARAENFADADGAWIFVYPQFIQLTPNTGLPQDGIGTVVVDDGAPIPLTAYDGVVGYVADEDDLPLLQAMAQGSVMTITVWPTSAPDRTVEYVYPLAGFREAYQRIAEECGFDASPVLDAAMAPPSTDLSAPLEQGPAAPSESTAPSAPSENDGGSSLFSPRK